MKHVRISYADSISNVLDNAANLIKHVILVHLVRVDNYALFFLICECDQHQK